MAARIRKAESRTRSMIAPERIEAVVHEKSAKMAQKVPVMLSPRFGDRKSVV